MIRKHYKYLCLLAVTIVGLHSSATAQMVDAIAPTLPGNDWSFWPDDNDQAPKRTVSGASRGSCSADELTALVPTSQYGKTSRSHPEILVAIPGDGPSQALFSIQSADDYYYESYIELPSNAGIISIPLPVDAPALDANVLYQWSLILMCNDRLRPDSPSLKGWIHTQSAPIINANDVTSLERASEYRKAHLWYDMIALLADLRFQEPNNQDTYNAWNDILGVTELESVAGAPILK